MIVLASGQEVRATIATCPLSSGLPNHDAPAARPPTDTNARSSTSACHREPSQTPRPPGPAILQESPHNFPTTVASETATLSVSALSDQTVPPPHSILQTAPSFPADAASSAPYQTSSCRPSHTPRRRPWR